MTSIKKCVVIPIEKYNHLVYQARAPSEHKEKELVTDPIIEEKAEKVVQTGQGSEALYRESVEEVGSSKWLFGLPARYKRNVSAILNHLKDHGNILSWNHRGEIIYKNHVIEGSNISDLLKDSQRHYKNLDPYGGKEFYRAWAELNIPEGLLGNEKRQLEVRYYKNNPEAQYMSPPPGIPQRESLKHFPSKVRKRQVYRKVTPRVRLTRGKQWLSL